FTPDGRLLIAAGRAGVRVHDLAKGELIYKFPADPLRGAAISLSPDGRCLIVRENGMKLGDAGKDGIRRIVPDPKIQAYDLTTGAVDEALTERLARYGNAIYCPGGRFLAAIVLVDGQYFERRVEFLDD